MRASRGSIGSRAICSPIFDNRPPFIACNSSSKRNASLIARGSGGSTKGNVLIGKPYLESVKVKGKILEHLRGKKTIVYKMRPKKKTRKKQGHRQELTRVLIEDIVVK